MPKGSLTTIFFIRNMTKTSEAPVPETIISQPDFRPLKWWEKQQLEKQGCTSLSWPDVEIHPGCDLSLLRNVDFEGSCRIGLLDSGDYPGCGISNARLVGCTVGSGVRIRNIGGAIVNAVIGDEAVIENTGRVEFEPEATCGLGLPVAVLDETGSRPVPIYPGLTSQSATLMARDPKLAEEALIPQTIAYCEEMKFSPEIGERAEIRDCGTLFNVSIGREVKIEGARRLANGMIINNAAPGRPLAFVGSGVDADGFIIEDGRVDSGTLLRNVYVGQGVTLEKGFTAHDSLFFANCSMENGEACALLAGPYTVSMHKGTLLIGAQTSFMNAGSSTNQSNHMYKLGPVHWGILERGVKTSSNSYLMHGAAIGAFSLLMGDHKTHPNSTEFPFSYLFGDAQGATVVVPAMMLRSCGLMRDEMKWPTRDRRLKRKLPLNDRIIFEVLNPYTVSRILKALDTINDLLHMQADDDRYIRYKGMKISRASLERARKLYTLAVFKYLANKLPDGRFPERQQKDSPAAGSEWLDLAGLILTHDTLNRAREAKTVEEREAIFSEAFDSYPEKEKEWIGNHFDDSWRVEPERIKIYAEEFDRLIEEDRTNYRESLQAEADMLKL